MKTSTRNCLRKAMIVLLCLFVKLSPSFAVNQVTLTISNCSAGQNYFQFEVFAQNTSSVSTDTMWFQAFTIRETYLATLNPAGTNNGTFTYQGGGDPNINLLFGTANGMSTGYTAATRQMQTTTSTVKYGSPNQSTTPTAMWLPGQNWSLGIYRFTNTSQNFNCDSAVGLSFLSTAGLNAYTSRTAGSATVFNSVSNRVLGSTCNPALVINCTCALTVSNLVPVACFGNLTGSASVTFTGIGISSTYTLDGNSNPFPANPLLLTNLAAGPHTISAVDAGNPACTPSANFTIGGPTSPQVGSLTTSACDSIRINNQLFTSTGTYIQHITTTAGCDSTVTLNLTINHAPSTPTASVTIQPSCTTPTGTIVVTAPTGAIKYSVNGTAYQVSGTFSGLTSNTYNVTAKDSVTGCVSSATVLTVNAIPTRPAAPTASVTIQPTCVTPTGTIVVTAPTGAAIKYSIDGINYQSSLTFTGVAPNAYNVTAKDTVTGCVSTQTIVNVNQPPGAPPAPTASVTVQPTCAVPTGTIVVTSPTGANFQYSIGGAYQASGTFTGVVPGTYGVTVKDINTLCVSSPTSLTVNTAPGGPAAPTVVTVQPTCSTSTGTIIVTAPVGDAIKYSINGSNYQASGTFSLVAPNTYNVTAKDTVTGCVSAPTIVTINPAAGGPPAPTASVTIQPTCTTPTGTIVVTAPTGANIQYSTGGAYQASGTFSGVAPGTYSITAKDVSTGCISSATSVTVNSVPSGPAAPTASVTVQPTCAIPTGTIVVTAPTGANIQYSVGGAYQASGTFSGLAPGPYSVTAKDISTGCVSTATSLTVNGSPGSPAAPTASVTIQPTCATPTGTIVVTAPTGASIQYSIGGAYQVSGTFSGVAPGTYSVTAKDITTGCVSSATSVTVNAVPAGPAAPTASVTVQPTCVTPTGTIVVTAPTGANIQYSIGGAYQASGTFTGLTPGPYNVTAKDINTGCISSATVLTVNGAPGAPAAPTASVTVQPTCTTPTGTIVVTAPTGANIQYSTGGAYQASGTFSGVAPGTYSVTAKDVSTGCVSSATSVTVNAVPSGPAAPTASVTVQPTCTTPTGTILVTAPTGANIQYSIGSGYQAGGTFNGVIPGVYSVTAKDVNTGCISSPTSVTVNQVPANPAAPTASVTVQPTCAIPTGTIVVTAPTGANIQYSVGGAYQASGTFSGLAPGPYSVTAKDISTGCVSTATSLTVNGSPGSPAAPTASVTIQPTCATPTGTIVVTAPTGASIQYSIGGAYQVSGTFSGVAPGTYSVTAKDITTGCVSSATSVTVNAVPAGPAAPTASVTVQPTCVTPTGTIVVTAPTGANIQYSIGGAYQASGTFTGLTPGPYNVTAKDINTGCISSATVLTVNGAPGAPAAPTASVTVQPTCTTPTGTIVVTAPTGANIQYSTGGAYQASGTFSGVAPGTYSVTAKDVSTGCVSSATSVTVNAVPSGPAAPTASVTVQPTCTTPTGTILVTAPTGANIQYSIGGAYQASGTFSGLAPGPYSVTAKDISTGCVSSPTSLTVNAIPTPPAAPTASVTVQPTCAAPTGTIVVTAPTGANIQYSIGGAYQASGTFSGLAPGLYPVTAKDISTGCVSSATNLTVNGSPGAPAAPTASVTVQPTCAAPTGTIVITAPTGANIQYSIGGAYQTSDTFTGLTPGSYSVTAKDISTGCVSSATVLTVNGAPGAPAAPTASVTIQPTCTSSTGTIVVTAPTGANIQYSIGSAYQASGTFSGVASGTYSVTAKDVSTGCVSSATSVTVNPVPSPPAAPTASVSVQPTCATPTGTIVVTAPAGANIQYSIGGAYQASGTFSGLAPGSYNVTAKDVSTGCVSSATSLTVNGTPGGPAAPTASVTVQPTCVTPTGTIVVTAPTGASIQYSIGGAYQASVTFSNVAPGTYSVTAKDISTGCVSSATSVTVNQAPGAPAAPTASVTVEPTCASPTGTIVVTAPTGANIQYSIGGAYQVSGTFSGLAPGPYNVTAKDISSGCVSASTFLTVNSVSGAPSAPTVLINHPTCSTPTGTITVSFPLGATIQYSIGGAYQASTVFNGVAPGTYSVTVKDVITGCVSSATSATVNPIPTPPVTPIVSIIAQPTCASPTGTIVVTAPPPLENIEYSNGGTYQASDTFYLVTPGTYSITAMDISTGCVTQPTVVTINPPPPGTSSTANVSICEGQSYTPPGGIPMTTTGTQVSHLTNAAGCDSAITTNLTVNPLPNANAGADASLDCTTGTVQLNGSSLTSGVSFSWTASNGGHILSGANTATPVVDSTGTYTLTVTVILTGCSSTDVAIVTPCSISNCLISGDTVICGNQSTTLCAPAGFASYQWSTGATCRCITVCHSGTYCLTVTSATGAVSTCCVHVSVYAMPPCFSISGDDRICPGQSTTLCAPAGYAAYLWNNGATSRCITVSSSGNYSVTVTNLGGCTRSANICVNEISLPSCHISGSTSICQGQSTTLCVTAGHGNIYLWNTGATTRCINVQAAGTYSVTVSNHHGCASTCSATVTVAPPLVCSISGLLSICNGQSTTLCGPAGYSYHWSNGSHSRCIAVSCAGTYTLTITNSSGCSSTCSVQVTVSSSPNFCISGNTAICSGQSTTLCAPPGYATYLWNNGATTNCITVSSAGTYQVTVTNSNGCSASRNVCVRLSTPVCCNITGNTSICNGQSSSLCAPSGCGNTYLWNNGATTRCICVTSAGTYSVTVSNPDGCPSTCSVQVTTGGPISSTIAGNTTICQGQHTTLSAPPGYASYHWSNCATTSSITVSCAGTYSVTVTNAGGCTSTSSVCVTVTPGPNSCISGNTTFCQGSSTCLSAPSGCASYLWNTGATTRSITVNCSGTYCVTVTNSAGCSSSSSVCVQAMNCHSGCSGNTRVSSNNDGGTHGMEATVYPNPFNASTTVEFTNPELSAAATLVEIYSFDGRKVAELFNGNVEGNSTNRIKWEAADLADGTYMYRIVCGDQVSTGRIVLMKE